MKNSEKINVIKNIDPNIVTCDGFDDALIGYCDILNKSIAVYNKEQVINILMTKNNWTEDEAEDFFEYNILGAKYSDLSPGFITYF